MTVLMYVEATMVSWRMIWMPTVFFVLPMAALTGFLFVWLRGRVQRQYKALADRFDLRYKSSKGLLFPFVEGQFRGRKTRFWQDWLTARTLRAEVEVILCDELDGVVSIHHRRRATPAMLKSRLKTGFRAFDQTYVVNASSPELVRQVLTTEVMEAFGVWIPIMKNAARIGGVHLTGRSLSFGDELSILSRSRRELFERALGMLTDLANMLEPLLATRLSTPIDTMSIAERAERVGSMGSARNLQKSAKQTEDA